MTILYIGQYTPGTTSKMRADQLNEILTPETFKIIDTHQPFFKTSKIFRSLGFRYKRGPLVANTNLYMREHLKSSHVEKFDLIWVDKGVYITKETATLLRQKSNKLVHFTPDMAFYGNKSRHFINSISNYDFVITTKTVEASIYNRFIKSENLILTTQGFDNNIHKPLLHFNEKENVVAFIGLAESSRFHLVKELISSDIPVKVAGNGWSRFAKTHAHNSLFSYHGEGLYGENYTKFISSSLFSIGMLSKRFPELHTTRTFEIPACGTALITERNDETCSFFNEDEAIFYDTPEEMIEKIKYYQNHIEELELLTAKGRKRVVKDGREYKTILEEILKRVLS